MRKATENYAPTNDYGKIGEDYQKVISMEQILFPIYRDLPRVIENSLGKHYKKEPLLGLDYGCGPGTSTPQILKTFNQISINVELTGVDRDPDLINLAIKAQAKVEQKISYQVIEENKVPYPNQHFHLAFCFFVLLEQESIARLTSLLVEIFRVMKPGGKLFTINCNPWLYNPELEYLYEDNKVKGNKEVFEKQKSGEKIGLRSLDKDGNSVIFRDFFWTREDYKKAAKNAGFLFSSSGL